MQNQVHIAPATGFVSVDGVGYDKLDPKSLQPEELWVSSRDIMAPGVHMVAWDGRDGTIQRKSAVAGKFDVTNFADPVPLEPFVALWQAEHERRLAAAEEQARVAAQINADIAAQAEARRLKAEEEARDLAEVMPQDGTNTGGKP